MNPGQRIYESLAGVEGVAPGGTATARIPTNRRHIMIRVFASATIGGAPSTDVSQIIEEVTTMIGSKVIRLETTAFLLKHRAFYKDLGVDPSGSLCLYYAEPFRADVLDEVVTSFDTFGDINTMVLKFKIFGGISNVALRLVDVYDNSVLTDAKNQKIRQIVKRAPINFNLGSVGDIQAIPVDLPILGIFLIGQAGVTIDHVKATVDDTNVIHDMSTLENAAFLSDYNKDATQFSYPLRFDVESQISRRLEGVRNLNLRVTSSAPQSITAMVEYVAPDYI